MSEPSVLIPAINEPFLPKLLTKLQMYNVDVRGEKGLSNAIYNGLQAAKGEYIVVMDGDGSHPPEAIEAMLNLLDEQTWLVVGSRYCRGGYSYDSLLRKIVSLFYCKVAQVVLRTRIKDSMSGYWVGYRRAFNFKPSKTYKFGLQLIRNYKNHVKEYPIIFSERQQGKTHVKPIQAIKDFLAIFAFS